jgi:hypothetical protein
MCGAPEHLRYHNNYGSESTVVETVEQTWIELHLAEPMYPQCNKLKWNYSNWTSDIDRGNILKKWHLKVVLTLNNGESMAHISGRQTPGLTQGSPPAFVI